MQRGIEFSAMRVMLLEESMAAEGDCVVEMEAIGDWSRWLLFVAVRSFYLPLAGVFGGIS